MEEILAELIQLGRMWLYRQILDPPRGTAVITPGCHELDADIDLMSDLDDGQPYIWNRTDVDP